MSTRRRAWRIASIAWIACLLVPAVASTQQTDVTHGVPEAGDHADSPQQDGAQRMAPADPALVLPPDAGETARTQQELTPAAAARSQPEDAARQRTAAIPAGTILLDSIFAPQAAPTSLVSAFNAAREYDPQFRAALAERIVNQSSATISRWAYAPQLQYSYQQVDLENSARSTLSVSQPLFSGDRLLSLRQAGPRTLLAESTMAQREQDLALRLLRSVTDLLRARSAVRVSADVIRLLGEQASQAQRMFELGRGTITDVRDTAVRFEQAKANQLVAQTQFRVAENQFAAIVGILPASASFAFPEVPSRFGLESVEHYQQEGQNNNPQVLGARQAERIAELDSLRAKALLLPTVSAIGVQSQSSGRSNSFVGLTVIFPLQAQTVIQTTSAAAQAERAREQRRAVEQTIAYEIDRLRARVGSGQQELAIRREAILAAELAIEANLRSQEGGFRTRVDVLNSIQTLANVRNDYALTGAVLAEDYLSLLLQAGDEPPAALTKIQQALFGG